MKMEIVLCVWPFADSKLDCDVFFRSSFFLSYLFVDKRFSRYEQEKQTVQSCAVTISKCDE